RAVPPKHYGGSRHVCYHSQFYPVESHVSTVSIHLPRQNFHGLLAPPENRRPAEFRKLLPVVVQDALDTPVGGVPQHQQAAVVCWDAVQRPEQIGALQNGVVDGWGWHYVVRGHPDEQPLSHRPAQVQLLASMQVALEQSLHLLDRVPLLLHSYRLLHQGSHVTRPSVMSGCRPRLPAP